MRSRPPGRGLNIGAAFFSIAFDNHSGLAPFETPTLLYQNYGNLITTRPAATVDALVANALAMPTSSTSTAVRRSRAAGSVYAFFDTRKRNLGRMRVEVE